jgi:adenylylsulfate kinase-like enzyme
MKEDADDAPADVFFSLKQRLQKANVWLVGMDGSSKNAIGKELAKKLVHPCRTCLSEIQQLRSTSEFEMKFLDAGLQIHGHQRDHCLAAKVAH